MTQLPQQPHRLEPPEDLFYSFPFPLADFISNVAGGSLIYRRLSPCIVLRNVWRHVGGAKLVYKLSSVICLIAAHRSSSLAAHLASEYDTCFAFCRPGRSRGIGVDSKPVSVLHKQMPSIIELCLFSFSLLAQQSIWIGRRLMGLVRTLLAVKIHGRISWIIGRCFIPTIFLLETLKSCRRLNQGPIDCKMLFAEQPVFIRSLKHSREKCIDYIAIPKPLPVLAESRRIPDVIIHAQTDEPAEQHVVIKLVDQHPLASHAVQYLKQRCSKQLLRRDRRPTGFRIKILKPWRHIQEYLIHHRSDRAKRMILSDPLLQRAIAEHFVLMKVVSAHFRFLTPVLDSRLSSIYVPSNPALLKIISSLSFSAACYDRMFSFNTSSAARIPW